jgi:prevent-host-death family protein
MTTVVDIHTARIHLARLVDEVAAGGEVIIAKSGKPLARLSRVSPSPKRLGLLTGRLGVPDDFNAPLPPEVLDHVEGSCCPRSAQDPASGGHQRPAVSIPGARRSIDTSAVFSGAASSCKISNQANLVVLAQPKRWASRPLTRRSGRPGVGSALGCPDLTAWGPDAAEGGLTRSARLFSWKDSGSRRVPTARPGPATAD